MLDVALRYSLRARLETSRAALLASLVGVTERDFAIDLDDGTVVQLLARLAGEESRAASEALGEPFATREVERPMPPQAVHALAGAHYRALRYLESPQADEATAQALVAGVEERERAATARIIARPELPPLPVAAQAPEIPMIPPEQARRA